jgi:hypothetical protein
MFMLCNAALLTALAAAATASPTPAATLPWTSNATARVIATSRMPTTPRVVDAAAAAAAAAYSDGAFPAFIVDLDAGPQDRWTKIASLPYYRDHVSAAVAYLAAQVPPWLFPVLETVLGDVEGYFGAELGAEMKSLAAAFGKDKCKLGDIVAFNLIMQLESIGLNCSNWNTTGPTEKNDPGCVDIDPKQTWCYCHAPNRTSDLVSQASFRHHFGLEDPSGVPGLCTSVVAEDADTGHIYHGRNLDWNIPPAVREMAIDAHFQRGGKTMFIGTTVVGFVGVFNGMRLGQFSASINARGKGGKVIANILQMLRHKSRTPSQHLRMVLQNESVTGFQGAVSALSEGQQVDENYFIVGGVKRGEGAIISRDRDKAYDVWYLNETTWYRLQTNYDHWMPVPEADNRRTPGLANMNNMGPKGIGENGDGMLKRVLEKWPTHNHHTDYTGVFSAATGLYRSMIWMAP